MQLVFLKLFHAQYSTKRFERDPFQKGSGKSCDENRVQETHYRHLHNNRTHSDNLDGAGKENNFSWKSDEKTTDLLNYNDGLAFRRMGEGPENWPVLTRPRIFAKLSGVNGIRPLKFNWISLFWHLQERLIFFTVSFSGRLCRSCFGINTGWSNTGTKLNCSVAL